MGVGHPTDCVVLLLIASAMGISVKEPLIKSISDHLQMHRLMLVCPFKNDNSQLRRRWLSTYGRTVKIQPTPQAVTLKDLKSQNLVICSDGFPLQEIVDLAEKTPLAATNSSWVILDPGLRVKRAVKVRVNQRIFFLDTETNELHESYFINGLKVERLLCKFVENEVASGFDVLNLNEGQKGFLQRRSDFMGQKLVTMSEYQKPFITYDQEIDEGDNVQYTPSGDARVTLDETMIQGMFSQLFYRIMRPEMNFTTATFVRSDRRWGAVVNGEWDGMVCIVGDQQGVYEVRHIS